jgi:hypothetical protein
MLDTRQSVQSTLALGAIASAAFLIGCGHPPEPPANAQAPTVPWVSEACLLSSDEQIDTFIDSSMQAIVADRNAAGSNNGVPGLPFAPQVCPAGTYPAYCGGSGSVDSGNRSPGIVTNVDPKTAYDNWLSYVADEIRDYSPPPALGSRQASAPYEGLGQQYLALSEAAQNLDQRSYAHQIPNGNPLDGTFHPPGSSPCGKDTDCMQRQVEVASFLNVGEGLFLHFKGCSSSIRKSAADYLESKYEW